MYLAANACGIGCCVTHLYVLIINEQGVEVCDATKIIAALQVGSYFFITIIRVHDKSISF